MKRTIALLLVLILSLSLAACSVDEGKPIDGSTAPDAPTASTAPSESSAPTSDTDTTSTEPKYTAAELAETVMYIDGSAVSFGELRYQIASLMNAYEYYGDGAVDWDEEIEGKPAREFFVDEAIDTCKLFRAVERYAADNGYALDDTRRAEIDEEIAGYIENAGGEDAFDKQLVELGMDRELYEYLIVVPELYYVVYNSIFGEGGARELSDDAASGYFAENYLTTRHILKVAVDDSGDYLSDEETRKVYDDIAELKAKIDGGADFKSVADEESEDELLGETITFELSTMPDAYIAAAQSLKPGEMSDIVDIDGAYVLVKREALDESYLTENFDAIKEEYGLGLFRELLDPVRDGLSVEKTDAFSRIDVQEIYDAFFSA